MQYGYARSADMAAIERQVQALTAAGVASDRIWLDVGNSRQALHGGIAGLLPGDELVVCSFDRFGRSTRDFSDTLKAIEQRQATYRSLTEPTAAGRFLFEVCAAISEFEAERAKPICERMRSAWNTYVYARAGMAPGVGMQVVPEDIAWEALSSAFHDLTALWDEQS